MITEFIVGAGNTVALWVLGIFPPMNTDAIISASTALSTIGTYMGSMSVWVNWLLIATQVGLVLGLWLTFLVLKIIRQLLAHVPFFGGSG